VLKIAAAGVYINERQREFEALTRVMDIKTMFGEQLEAGTGIPVSYYFVVHPYANNDLDQQASLLINLGCLVGWCIPKTFASSQRRFVREGTVGLCNKNKVGTLFLFNDLAVRCRWRTSLGRDMIASRCNLREKSLWLLAGCWQHSRSQEEASCARGLV